MNLMIRDHERRSLDHWLVLDMFLSQGLAVALGMGETSDKSMGDIHIYICLLMMVRECFSDSHQGTTTTRMEMVPGYATSNIRMIDYLLIVRHTVRCSSSFYCAAPSTTTTTH